MYFPVIIMGQMEMTAIPRVPPFGRGEGRRELRARAVDVGKMAGRSGLPTISSNWIRKVARDAVATKRRAKAEVVGPKERTNVKRHLLVMPDPNLHAPPHRERHLRQPPLSMVN